jgi:hypothetical protein
MPVNGAQTAPPGLIVIAAPLTWVNVTAADPSL